MCFRLTKPKCNFLATTKGIFWRKRGEAFVEKNIRNRWEKDPNAGHGVTENRTLIGAGKNRKGANTEC